MTEVEMAEKYCNNEVPFDTTESGEKLYTENDLKQAYLAGLKAGETMQVEQIKDVSDKKLEPILYRLKDLGVIKSWYYNGTYHAC